MGYDYDNDARGPPEERTKKVGLTTGLEARVAKRAPDLKSPITANPVGSEKVANLPKKSTMTNSVKPKPVLKPKPKAIIKVAEGMPKELKKAKLKMQKSRKKKSRRGKTAATMKKKKMEKRLQQINPPRPHLAAVGLSE